MYLTFNTINTSNLIYLRHPYGGFTRQQMILCCFCFHLAALSVNGRSERLLFQPLYKCRHISLISDRARSDLIDRNVSKRLLKR